MIRFTQKGMTLIEITVVLTVLIALAGITIPYIGGINSKTLCDATDISMANIKRAIMDRYYLDTLGKFPQDLSGLTSAVTPKYSLHYLFSKQNLAITRTHKDFSPDTSIGWHGPYLNNGLVLDATDIGNLDASFKDSGGGTPHVNTNFAVGHSAVLDAWGRPIAIQESSSGFRLVSAGSGSGLGTGNARIETTIAGNRSDDDRVLYLNMATPAADVNPSCE